MNALVTGANGFLGKYIVEQLLGEGWCVRTINRREDSELNNLGVEQHLCDIRQLDNVTAACEKIDTVFHVAGVAGIWGPWDHYHGINTVGTQNVIAGCHRFARWHGDDW